MGFFDFIRKLTGSDEDDRLEKISGRIAERQQERAEIEKKQKALTPPAPSPWYKLSTNEVKKENKRNFTPPPFGKVTTMAALFAKREKEERERIARLHAEVSNIQNNIERCLRSRDVSKVDELLTQALPILAELKDSTLSSCFNSFRKRLQEIKEDIRRKEIEAREEEERRRAEELARQEEIKRQQYEREQEIQRRKEQEAREYEERLAQQERKRAEELNRLTRQVTQKKTNPEAYINHLRLHGVRYFYHFTDENNLLSIRKMGGLYSWHYCETNGIRIPNPGGDGLSRGLDSRYGLQDYVRLSFCTDHPMAYRKHLEGAKLVLLKISLDVATFKDTMFSDMNATDTNHSHGSGLSDLQNVDIGATKASYVSKDSPLFHTHQAECMVRTFIPVEYIENINNPQRMIF